MNPLIKTTNNQWKKRFFSLLLILILILVFLVVYIMRNQIQVIRLKLDVLRDKETHIQIGQNSTINYIIGNEKYPVRFKKNTIWITKEELCKLE